MQESQLIGERAALRCLLHQHPEWTNEDFALAIGRSVSWVKKWKQRLRQARADDLQVLHSHSRARHTPPPPSHPHLVERILEIREKPPDNLQRVPGPKAILYFLQRDASLQALGIRAPRSTRTVWKILRKAGCILDPPQRKRRPLPPREPLEEIQVDFKDASTVAADPSGQGKHQHVVEVCHGVDAGTSTLLLAQPHQDYHAETALEAVVELFRRYGLPEILTFDRDPRWVGSSTGRDFPSAFCRFLLCLGVQPNICPPHRPDRNAYVERYHRSYNQECLQVHRPSTLQEVCEVTEQYMYHYNHERPHQGRSCGNRPPREAFPTLPTLPALPQMVDPDRWLQAIHGQAFVRRVGRDGCLDVDHQTYYVSRSLAGQQVALFVNAYERVFELFHEPLGHKQLPIKGVMARPMPFEQYLAFITEQARSEARHAQVKRHARSQEIKPEAGSQGQQVQTKPPTPRQLRFWD